MITLPNCTECGKPGGAVPRYFSGSIDMEEVRELMHDECALASITRYIKRKELERLST